MIRRVLGSLLLAAACTAAISATAEARILVDQYGDGNGGAITSSDFGDASHVAQGADDFTVPPGDSWLITSARFKGAGPAGWATVSIYADGGGLPGALQFERTVEIAANGADFYVPIASPQKLNPGTYWVSILVSSVQQWSWSSNDTQRGALPAWRNPGLGYTSSCPAFQPLTTCIPAATPVKSFEFQLREDVSTRPPSAAAKKRRQKCKKKPKKRTATAKKKRCKKKVRQPR